MLGLIVIHLCMGASSSAGGKPAPGFVNCVAAAGIWDLLFNIIRVAAQRRQPFQVNGSNQGDLVYLNEVFVRANVDLDGYILKSGSFGLTGAVRLCAIEAVTLRFRTRYARSGLLAL
jgi:hypothetical protein